MAELKQSSQRIYQGKVVTFDILDVTLPDGKPAKRELIIHPGAVAIVPLDADENVYLVRQFRIAANQDLLEIPAGTLEPNEDPAACAERELQEEAGVKPASLQSLGGLFVAPGYTTEYIHLFLAQDLTPSELPKDDDEFIDVIKMPFTEALALIEQDAIRDGKTIAGLLRVARLLGY
jgi:ADP-ribose pyrophosphatase